MMAQAQSVPAGWKVIKESVCQMAVPPNWQPGIIPSMANDAKNTITVQVAQETHFKFARMSEGQLKGQKAVKVFENSDKRVFIEGQPTTFMGKTTRSWDLWVPAPNSSCHGVITLGTGADEATAQKVAGTLQSVK
jgi:hypothetical protein